MTPNEALAQFAKCGGALHHLARRFHSLPPDARRDAIEAICNGIDAAKAIRQAKRKERTK